MPFYRLRRHVVYDPACQQTREVWGIDRKAPGLRSRCAPRDTDADDPLSCGSRGGCCDLELLLLDGDFVEWGRIWEWMSVAEEKGYEVVSGFKKLSPYSVIVIRSDRLRD